MQRRYTFRKHYKRPFHGEMACFPTLDALPNISNCCDHSVANVSACRRITQPIGIMREWKRSGKAVNMKCNGAHSSELDPNFLSSKVDEAPEGAVARSTHSGWSGSEERARDAVRSKDIHDVLVDVVERILRAFPHWYPRNSPNCFVEILKRIPFEMSLSVPATAPLDFQNEPTCSRAPLSRPVSFRDPVPMKLSTLSDSRCERLSNTRQSICLTNTSYGNSSPMFDQCVHEISTMHKRRSQRKRTHQPSFEKDYILSPRECQWQPKTYDNRLEEAMPANSSHVCDCAESVDCKQRLSVGCTAHFEMESPVITQTLLISRTEAGTSKMQKPAVAHIRHEPIMRSSVSEYLDEIDMSLLTSPLEPASVGVRKTFSHNPPSFQSEFRYYQHRMF
ncbi:hypothetical protein D918_04845 [Trichuris suis]|nr:hypothetical protein D918_04845 [Trichuris suis]